MKTLARAVGLTAASLFSCAASAEHIPSQSQTFAVSYVEHGSSGPQEFSLYSGPYHLAEVEVEWEGYAESGYENPAWVDDGSRFAQPYDGYFGFYTYGSGASDSMSFSGTATCSYGSCDVGSQGGRTAFFGPSGFTGTGTDIIDCACGISPNFTGYPEFSGTDLGVSGTITYIFSSAPEPATWAMMLGGFGLVGGALRRRPNAVTSFR
jgi:hypothetical protein